MRAFYLGLFLLTFLVGHSQNNVVFSVDMSEYPDTYTTVNLNGNFNDWCGLCATMTDDNSDGIYELTVDLPDGDYEYKFTVDGWDDQEFFTPGAPCTLTSGEFTNRFVTVSGDATLPTVCWESCADCGTVTSADVTFQVDMSEYVGDITTVNLNGTFNNWCGECAAMTDDNQDGIYELTINVTLGAIEYKFTVNGWDFPEQFTEGDPCTITTGGFTNRYLEVSEEMVIEPVCWNSCEACEASSVTDLSFAEFSFFPNPSTGEIRLVSELSFNTIRVYDLAGSEVYQSAIEAMTDIIDLSSLDAGLYMVELNSKEGRGIRPLIIK